MQFDEETNLTPADRELEAALKSLAPSRSTRVNPVDAAFTAGGRSARRQLRVWQSATAALMLVAIGSWLPTRGGRAAAPPTVIATVPDPMIVVASTSPALPPPPPLPASTHSLLMLQEAVRERGTDGLPTTELPTVRNLRVADFF